MSAACRPVDFDLRIRNISPAAIGAPQNLLCSLLMTCPRGKGVRVEHAQNRGQDDRSRYRAGPVGGDPGQIEPDPGRSDRGVRQI